MLDTNLLIYLAMFLALILLFNSRLNYFIKKNINTIEDGQNSLKNFFNEFAQKSREESLGNILKLGDSINSSISNLIKNQNSILSDISKKIEILTKGNIESIDKIKDSVSDKLLQLQKDNAIQLEKMRVIVDEKLQSTLEKRLDSSFKIVSDRLEIVHKGLGEMNTLATGVGDLKQMLTNVKLRGTWGEVQLQNILEQILSPEQFVKNASVMNNSGERVEFAVKLPGTGGDSGVLLPIDSKFPIDDYKKIVESDDVNTIKTFSKQLEKRVKLEAKTICDKYINPPHTTDFAIMFLPTEGLYSEVLKIPGFFEHMQKNYRVIIAGPWTLAAILNSLRLGFKTLAIEKRSSEVWKVLGTIKTEFGKFGDLLEKTHKKLNEASNVIDSASRKSRTIERKLGKVEMLPMDKKLIEGEVDKK